MAFGQTVRFHRNAKGFGLNEFAERPGVSPAY
jgi:HTH-type transcriptional regulator, competence development regulator